MGFFGFPLYFLPVVVAVVFFTGVAYSGVDVAVYQRISAKSAAQLGSASCPPMSVRLWHSSCYTEYFVPG